MIDNWRIIEPHMAVDWHCWKRHFNVRIVVGDNYSGRKPCGLPQVFEVNRLGWLSDVAIGCKASRPKHPMHLPLLHGEPPILTSNTIVMSFQFYVILDVFSYVRSPPTPFFFTRPLALLKCCAISLCIYLCALHHVFNLHSCGFNLCLCAPAVLLTTGPCMDTPVQLTNARRCLRYQRSWRTFHFYHLFKFLYAANKNVIWHLKPNVCFVVISFFAACDGIVLCLTLAVSTCGGEIHWSWKPAPDDQQ